MSFTPALPVAGRVMVTQLVPLSTMVAAVAPTSTWVMLPKFPLVRVNVLPPAYGPLFVETA